MRFRLRRWGSVFLLLMLAVVWLMPEWFGLSNRRPTRTIDGARVTVRDGDTMTIAGEDYRLHGIDAPEFTQVCKTASGTDWPCGRQARAELAALVNGRTLSCAEHARDKYQRVIARCTDDRGSDVAQTMVARGFAVSFGGFAEGPYAADEARAKTSRRGLWQGAFEPPASWRTKHPRVPVANR